MPHQCVNCSKLHDDGASEILKGCQCGGKLFFYIRKDQVEKAKERVKNLSDDDKKQIEEDVYDILGDDRDRTAPVVLDFESINIAKPGKYEIDLVNLFQKKQPLVYRLDDGKYMIDLPESFKKMRKVEE